MKIIKDINEDEMIAEFLKAEINSDRWRQVILSLLQRDGVDRVFIDNPDTHDKEKNVYRKKLLGEFRGYGQNAYLFSNFPLNIKWVKALLTKEELGKVLYLDWDYWTKITDGTRSPKVLANKVLSGLIPEDKETARFTKVAGLLKSGVKFPELILVARDKTAKLVVIEGHVRLTAYFLTPETIPVEIEVIIGFSPDIKSWDNY